MTKPHSYAVRVDWTGNRGTGTSGYREYDRTHEITSARKPPIPGSSDPAFRGDAARYNPEELLVASLSTCHMLWYLHLAADAGIIVTAYTDDARGTMIEADDGSGRFTRVVLRPTVTVTPPVDEETAMRLHDRAHEMCFVANSVAFPVDCEARLVTAAPQNSSIDRY